MFASFALFLAAASLVKGSATPSEPYASTVGTVGKSLTAKWAVDPTGTWTDMTIALMTGDNFNMVKLTDVGTDIDATTETEYTFTVPDVSPNAAIYFLQFNPADNATDVQWTTRFTIAAADGSTTEPTNSTQPGGAAIPWGTGMLVANSTSAATTSGDDDSAVSSAVSVISSVSAAATSMVTAVSSASVSAASTSSLIASASSVAAKVSSSVVSVVSSASAAASSNTSSGNKVLDGSLGAAVLGAVGLAFML